jgi:hypothetical protein
MALTTHSVEQATARNPITARGRIGGAPSSGNTRGALRYRLRHNAARPGEGWRQLAEHNFMAVLPDFSATQNEVAVIVCGRDVWRLRHRTEGQRCSVLLVAAPDAPVWKSRISSHYRVIQDTFRIILVSRLPMFKSIGFEEKVSDRT